MLARILLGLVLCGLVACAGNSPAPIEDRVQPHYSVYTVKRGDTLYSIAFRYGLDFRDVAADNAIVAPYTIYPGQYIRIGETGPGQVAAARAAPAPAVAAPMPTYRSAPAAAPSQASGPAPPAQPSPPYVPATVPAPAEQVDAPQVQGKPPIGVATAQPAPVDPPPVAQIKQDIAADTYVGGDVGAWLWPTRGAVNRGFSDSVHKGIDIGGERGDPVIAVAAGKVVYAGTGIVGFGELLIVKHNDVYLSAYGHNERLLVAEGQSVAAGQKIAEKGSSGTDTVKLHFEIRKEGKPIDPQRLLPRR